MTIYSPEQESEILRSAQNDTEGRSRDTLVRVNESLGKMLPFPNEILKSVNITGRDADAFQTNLEILQRGRDREAKIMLPF